jgi:hypothetical protein
MLKSKARRPSAFVDLGTLGGSPVKEGGFQNPMRQESEPASDHSDDPSKEKKKTHGLFTSSKQKNRRPSAEVDEATAYGSKNQFDCVNPNSSEDTSDYDVLFGSKPKKNKNKKKRRGSAQLDDMSSYLSSKDSFIEGSNPSAVDIALKLPPTFQWKQNSATNSRMLCGWLHRLGSRGKWNQEWKRRYFVLSGSDLDFFSDETLSKQKGSIDLLKATDVKVSLGW